MSLKLLTYEEYHESVEKYQEEGYRILTSLNECIQRGTIKDIVEFLEIIQTQEYHEHYRICLPELSYASIFAAITVDEVKQQRTSLFLSKADSIQGLIRRAKKIEFLFWRIEIENEAGAETELYEYITSSDISVEALHYLIQSAGMDKKKLYYILGCIFCEHGRTGSAKELFDYAIKFYPEDVEFKVFAEKLDR